MAKFRHYSPQLSRELVHRLYHRAKAQRIPMTVLANQLMEEALGSRKLINRPTVAKKEHITEPN